MIMPFMLGLWDDAQVAALAGLARAIQAEGVPAVLQIVHGGAKAFRDDLAQERIGPSTVALMPGPAPRSMTEAEIQGAIEAFARSAARAKAAGFDGVEIHAAHYYLISQFLSPYTNHRGDRWGGDWSGRLRLAVAVVRAVREAVGEGYPVFCRMHSVECLEGGLSSEEAVLAAQALVQAGVDVIDASGIGQASLGQWQGQPFLNASSLLPKEAAGGAFAASAGRIRAAVGVPVITVGKLSEPGVAQAVLDAGQADLIALARPLIADPRAAAKLLAGQDAGIVRCKECLACFAAIRKGPIRCSMNPAV
jgi:2,4-dienoyl-CoA reductase-like NADH-dependent reductase (Old Yellow Enzyme family)